MLQHLLPRLSVRSKQNALSSASVQPIGQGVPDAPVAHPPGFECVEAEIVERIDAVFGPIRPRTRVIASSTHSPTTQKAQADPVKGDKGDQQHFSP